MTRLPHTQGLLVRAARADGLNDALATHIARGALSYLAKNLRAASPHHAPAMLRALDDAAELATWVERTDPNDGRPAPPRMPALPRRLHATRTTR
ncbi:MAG: hypothetical protein AAF715_19505 [Myxococcota bacterium]